MAKQDCASNPGSGVAANEAESRAMVARGGVQAELSDDELERVVGGTTDWEGGRIGDYAYVSGSLYQSSYGDNYCGEIHGNFHIQRYAEGRFAPYQLKTNVGWVEASSIIGPARRP